MILVTGASGLLGQSLVRRAVLEGKSVRILLRDPHSLGFEGLEVERVHGNITDPLSLERAFKGVDTVFHTAALPTNLPGMYHDLYHVNVVGTENVIAACRQAGVRSLVFIANFQAIAPTRQGEPIREPFGFDPRHTLTDYGRTMALACQRVEAAHGQDLQTLILLPSYQLGPFDYKLSVMGRLLWNFARGRVRVLTSGGLEIVDSRDVASAALLALQKGRYGQSYLISGSFLSMEELMHWFEAMSGRLSPHLVVPPWSLYPLALFMEVQYRLHGEQPILNRSSLDIFARRIHCDTRKARSELGFVPRSLEETFADTWKWMEEHYHLVRVRGRNET